MPNLVSAVYAYVARTGDVGFYQLWREPVLRAGNWIAALDTDGDGLPDQNTFPYGYYDSVANGVRHTYALAKFYASFRQLAELEQITGFDGTVWQERAERLHAGFHRPVSEGGYWPAGQPWPIAWRRDDGTNVDTLETFGVFEALRSGLIGPSDGKHYTRLMATLHEQLPNLIAAPGVMRLALGGYDEYLRRAVEPPVPLWMLDAGAPWIVGIAAPAYANAGYSADAAVLLRGYAEMARATEPPMPEFVAGSQARYGPGDSGDRGRSWDCAAWFMAVYSAHYGLTPTPSALVVQPQPLASISDDEVRDFNYQGAMLRLKLDAAHGTYSISLSGKSARVILRPLGRARLVSLDGGSPQPEVVLALEPDREYTISSGDCVPTVKQTELCVKHRPIS